MSGRFQGLQTFEAEIPVLKIVSITVIAVVHYVKMILFKSRVFCSLPKDMDADPPVLLFHCDSVGKFLQLVYNLKDEIAIFL